MSEPAQNPGKTGPSRILLIVLLVIVIAVIGYGVYAILTNNANSNQNTNTVTNANVGVNQNTNANANASENLNVNGASNANTALNTNTSSNSNTSANSNTSSNNNTNVNMTGWRTYTDSKYSFTLKYPESWTYQNYTNGYNDEGAYVIAFTTRRKASERLPFLSVKENWSTALETKQINESDPPYTKVVKEEDITAGSFQAKKLTYDSTIGLQFERIIIFNGSTAYMFDCAVGDSDFETVAATLAFTR